MNTQNPVDRLMTKAQHNSTDAERLWQIAKSLERISAWTEARAVERLAEAAERAYAESAAK